MKTIQVEDDLYAFLHAMSKTMNEQDNAATADPILIQIEDRASTYVQHGDGDEVVLTVDGDEYEIDADGLRSLWDSYDEVLPSSIEDMILKDCYDIDEVEDMAKKKLDSSVMLIDKKYLRVYKNGFFTWDACRAHLKSNYYHYSGKARAFATHAWRNPEMDAVVKLLKSISKQEEINETATPV